MAKGVTIKGSGSGVILVLDDAAPYEDLRGELRRQVLDAAHFFKGATLPIRIRGRNLSEEEFKELVDIIEETAGVHNPEVILEPPVVPKKLSADEIFAADGDEEQTGGRMVGGDTEELSAVDQAILKELEKQLSGEFAIMYGGPVKNGETIRSDYSLVIMGDVREGGRVEAAGSIFVLGCLFGEAAAGIEGNRSAVVMSARLRPQGLSIGSLKGYRTPARLRKRPFGRKRSMEVACVQDGEIVRMDYGDFIRENAMS